LPESSRNRASTPYGRSAGSWRKVTPFADSSSNVFRQSSVWKTPPPREPLATSARTVSASSSLNIGGEG
jgi:hypothetical protein